MLRNPIYTNAGGGPTASQVATHQTSAGASRTVWPKRLFELLIAASEEDRLRGRSAEKFQDLLASNPSRLSSEEYLVNPYDLADPVNPPQLKVPTNPSNRLYVPLPQVSSIQLQPVVMHQFVTSPTTVFPRFVGAVRFGLTGKP